MARLKPQPDKKRSGGKNTPSGEASVWREVRSGRFRFAAAFSLSCIGIYAFIFFALPERYIRVIDEHTARTLGGVLNYLGVPVSVAGDGVFGGALAVRIVPECTALLAAGLFLSFVAFYSAPMRKKAAGLLAGIPALYLGNLIRLVAVFAAGRCDRRLFEVLHVYLGQVFTLALVFCSCILWLKWLDREEAEKGIPMRVASFLARFSLISGCIFLFWMEVQHGYIWFVDRFMILGSSFFGYRLIIPRNTAIYYETFNVVIFTSLVLAVRAISRARRIKGLAAGLAILFLLHLIHRIDNLLITGFHFTPVIKADYVLCAAGQYLLPVLLWLAVAGEKVRLTFPGHFTNNLHPFNEALRKGE